MGKVCAYAQGFTQYKTTSDHYDWNLPLKDIALIFRVGCIILAKFLNVISEAYQAQANLTNLLIAPYSAEKAIKSACEKLSVRGSILESRSHV
jgi:6-phosphogluconate dehydrogenase